MILSNTAQSIIDQAQTQVISRHNPLLVSLPDWVNTFRPHQVKAVEDVLDAFTRCDVVVLDAPTGSGKTLISEVVRRLLRIRKTSYICTTKSLQSQFARDYPYAKVLKGRSNYPTLTGPDWVTAEDCTYTKTSLCMWCKEKFQCPYEMAKRTALTSPLSVLNTAYFLTECNGPGQFSGTEFVIADEADTLEDQLMKYVSVEISARRVRQLKLGEPKKITKPESWKEWLDEAVKLVRGQRENLPSTPTEVEAVKESKYLDRLIQLLSFTSATMDSGDWVYTGKEGAVSFRPSNVRRLGSNYLWQHGLKWLLMSATVISAQEMLGSLGWDREYEVVRVPSTFSASRRPVVVRPVANMSRKVNEGDKLVSAIRTILADHPDDRVLIHTVSYDLARVVCTGLSSSGSERRVVTYTTSADRDTALAEFKRPGSVLVAPSLDRGVDLPDEACRVVIVAKVPYPNLGDRQIAARLYKGKNGQLWYNVATVRTIVQMFGRAMRSETDSFTGYALDSQFRDGLWSKARGLFPDWFKEALVWERIK